METKNLLAEAGLKTTDINLTTGYVSHAEAKRGSNRFVPKKGILLTVVWRFEWNRLASFAKAFRHTQSKDKDSRIVRCTLSISQKTFLCAGKCPFLEKSSCPSTDQIENQIPMTIGAQIVMGMKTRPIRTKTSESEKGICFSVFNALPPVKITGMFHVHGSFVFFIFFPSAGWE